MKNYFTGRELACKCCGQLVIDPDFLDQLNRAREIAGFPFILTSGYRCPAHNTAVGSTSQNHVRGMAADIKCDDARERYVMVRAMQAAGMLGIGIDRAFVHCDVNRTTPSLWLYCK